MINKNILLIANSEWYFINFRLEFLRYIQSLGYKVVLLFPFKDKKQNILLKDFCCYDSPISRGGISPIVLVRYLYLLKEIVKKENISIINAFSLQISLLTSFCNLIIKLPTILSITGLGYSFINKSFKALLVKKSIRIFGKYLFDNAYTHFIFQNNDDRDTILSLARLSDQNTSLILGSGVNTALFYPRKNKENEQIVFLFAGRLIYDKGIREVIEAFRKLLSYTSNISLLIAGDIDPQNPASVQHSEILKWRDIPNIEFLSHVDNMSKIYQKADVLILPSYREGLSKVLIEAASSGLPIITSNAPGCREVVSDNVNGFLVPVKSVHSLFLKMQTFIINPEIMVTFGRASRKIALKKFSISEINSKTAEVYNKILNIHD